MMVSRPDAEPRPCPFAYPPVFVGLNSLFCGYLPPRGRRTKLAVKGTRNTPDLWYNSGRSYGKTTNKKRLAERWRGGFDWCCDSPMGFYRLRADGSWITIRIKNRLSEGVDSVSWCTHGESDSLSDGGILLRTRWVGVWRVECGN